jgi:hypothetical protein
MPYMISKSHREGFFNKKNDFLRDASYHAWTTDSHDLRHDGLHPPMPLVEARALQVLLSLWAPGFYEGNHLEQLL